MKITQKDALTYRVEVDDKAKNGGYNLLEIQVDYSPGGYGGFDWTLRQRGYRLNLLPCSITIWNDGKEIRETSYGGDKGSTFIFLEETKRQSNKRMEAIASKLDNEKLTAITNLWLNDEKDALIDEVITLIK